MSWPSTDFELAIQNELDALHKLARAVIDMRRKFGDEYEGRFIEVDKALDEWAALFNEEGVEE